MNFLFALFLYHPGFGFSKSNVFLCFSKTLFLSYFAFHNSRIVFYCKLSKGFLLGRQRVLSCDVHVAFELSTLHLPTPTVCLCSNRLQPQCASRASLCIPTTISHTHQNPHLTFQPAHSEEIAPRQANIQNEVRPKYRVYFSCTSGGFLLRQNLQSLTSWRTAANSKAATDYKLCWFSDSARNPPRWSNDMDVSVS